MYNPKLIMSYYSIISHYIEKAQLKVFLMQGKVQLTSQLVTVFDHLLRRVT